MENKNSPDDSIPTAEEIRNDLREIFGEIESKLADLLSRVERIEKHLGLTTEN